MDQMRESVFACLGDLSGRSFLDFFSGSGIIALEAASRGAACVEAVENDPGKREMLLRNVSISPVRISCRFMSAELYVLRAKRAFDCIFLDPPFPYRFKWDLLSRIAASPLVSPGSLILLHRPSSDRPPEGLSLPPAAQGQPAAPGLAEALGQPEAQGRAMALRRADSREYGRSVVDFFRAEPAGGAGGLSQRAEPMG